MISIDEIIFIFSHRLMIFSSTFIHNNQNINFLFIIFVVMKICLFMFHCVNFDSINNRNHWWISVDNKNEYQYFHSHCQQFVDIINLFFEEWTKIRYSLFDSFFWHWSFIFMPMASFSIVWWVWSEWLFFIIKQIWELLPLCCLCFETHDGVVFNFFKY